MDEIILETVGWFGVASVIVFSLLLLGLFVFIWQVIQSFFPQPHSLEGWEGMAIPGHWQPTQPIPQEDPMASEIKRAVGYCNESQCEEFEKGVFLLNHGSTFWCSRCKKVGFMEYEVGSSVGNSGIYKEARVEYNYDPSQKRYREIAIVRDESLWGKCDVYHLNSPLIKTEKRALKVAEALLANLNMQERSLVPGEIPRTTEIILSFDVPKEKFCEEVSRLRGRLENNAWGKACKARKAESTTTIADIGL